MSDLNMLLSCFRERRPVYQSLNQIKWTIKRTYSPFQPSATASSCAPPTRDGVFFSWCCISQCFITLLHSLNKLDHSRTNSAFQVVRRPSSFRCLIWKSSVSLPLAVAFTLRRIFLSKRLRELAPVARERGLGAGINTPS